MPPSISSLMSRWAARVAASRFVYPCVALIALMWFVALALMYVNEGGYVANSIFLLTWGLLNCFWLVLFGRPLVAAALSLGTIVLIMLLSHLKFSIVWMTANFLDVWIINSDTFSYLLAVKPDLYRDILIAAALILPVLGL